MEQIDIDHIAKLAKLELTDEEKVKLGKDLPKILEYIGQLSEVDTSNIDTKAYITDLENVFVDDEISESTTEERDAIIEAFPQKTGNALEVPAIFE